MTNELDNPFSVTKATEFSDFQINEYWVDFNTKENVSIDSILNPSEYLPKYLIGGKGCGKTHILRYFSFPLQKIRNKNNVYDILSKDKYIGLYSVLHGLNSSRFRDKGIDESEWKSVFEYYFELYISDNLLRTLKEIIFLLKLPDDDVKKLLEKILRLFNNNKDIQGITSFDEFIDFLTELRRKIDSQVLNAAFTRKLDYLEIKVLFSPGDLLFGIPECLSTSIIDFDGVKFIYIFDEYEKLFEWQKIFINSLVWDKIIPVTFWVGARRFGYTTRNTKSGQEMKSGSEFQEIDLDVLIRNNEEIYKQFAEKLYTNRLYKYYESKGLIVNPDQINTNFCAKFEGYSEAKILNEIIEKNSNKEFRHLKDLRSKLKLGLENGLSLDLKAVDGIDFIVNQITLNAENNPLYQKYKLFYLYKLWSKRGKATFEGLLRKINIEFSDFLEGKKNYFNEIVDKRKKDLIAQLTKENNVKNTEYAGIRKFIELSQGNPRSFILILKKAVEYARIRGEKPLEDGGKFSLDSQYLAVFDTAEWFYKDAELIGEDGKKVYNAIKNLTDYFMLHRFCDKPTDTTISCFYIKSEELSSEALKCIEEMKMHAFIIEDEEGRKERNTGLNERKYQLNKILSPKWNLPTAERGSLYLSAEVAEAIFNFDKNQSFDGVYKKRKHQLEAPYFSSEPISKIGNLFN